MNTSPKTPAVRPGPAPAATPVPATTAGTGTPRRRNRPKEIGTKAETAVVRFLRDHGFPGAERRTLKGGKDQGDITGTPGVAWEIKTRNRNVSDAQIADWWDEAELEREHAEADVAVLVVKRPGHGLENAGDWWAYMDLASVTALATAGNGFLPTAAPNFWVKTRLRDIVLALRWAGYGEPLPPREVGE
ncbi:hypothetical protein [Microbispora sp. CA-102843]|uniref:hypothetical protein n=1 Tax=Microbispora sp. CA-102843 TaxID=3239952 RepID=UPI003D8AD7F4